MGHVKGFRRILYLVNLTAASYGYGLFGQAFTMAL